MPVDTRTYMDRPKFARDPLQHPDVAQTFNEGRAAALDWFVREGKELLLNPEQAAREYLGYLGDVIAWHNEAVAAVGRGARWPVQKNLEVKLNEVARMMVAFNDVALVSASDRFEDVEGAQLMMYVWDRGLPEWGTYTASYDIIAATAMRYTGGGAPSEAALIRELRAAAVAARAFLTPCDDPNIVPVANGLFDFARKRLDDFTPEKVFTWKSPVKFDLDDYELSVKREGEEDWEVDKWLDSLSDDPEVRDLIWRLPTIVLRPRVQWGKAFLLYSTVGNNGKGTLVSVLRSLVGEGNYCTLSLSEVSDASKAEALVGKVAVLNDENNVGERIARTRELKAAITGDAFTVNRKYREVESVQFHGTVVECVNELPEFADTSESMYRRLVCVPFEKNFSGVEDRRIKDDYLKRPEILQGILLIALWIGPTYGHDIDRERVDEPEACRQLLVRLRARKNPVKAFFDMVVENGVRTWSTLPVALLWDAYKEWLKGACPGRDPGDMAEFRVELATAAAESVTWDATKLGPQDAVRVKKGSMDGPEPALERYGVTSAQASDVVKGALTRL